MPHTFFIKCYQARVRITPSKDNKPPIIEIVFLNRFPRVDRESEGDTSLKFRGRLLRGTIQIEKNNYKIEDLLLREGRLH